MYYSKEQQLKHFKSKKKSKTKNVSTEDRNYLQWLKDQVLVCFKCGKVNGIELHHIKDYSMQKKNHKEVIPLCGIECHRLGKYSIHGNSKWFKNKYPIEAQRIYAKKLYEIYILNNNLV